jgi:phosphate/sulfate permease
MDIEFFRQLSLFPFTFAIIIGALTVIVHVLFAAGVARDAGSIQRSGLSTEIVSPLVWVLSVLLGGVFAAAVYWLIHHSSLRRGKIWTEN